MRRTVILLCMCLTACDAASPNATDELDAVSLSERVKQGDRALCADQNVTAGVLWVATAELGRQAEWIEMREREEIPHFTAVSSEGFDASKPELSCSGNVTLPIPFFGGERAFSLEYKLRPNLSEPNDLVVEVSAQDPEAFGAAWAFYLMRYEKREQTAGAQPDNDSEQTYDDSEDAAEQSTENVLANDTTPVDEPVINEAQ